MADDRTGLAVSVGEVEVRVWEARPTCAFGRHAWGITSEGAMPRVCEYIRYCPTSGGHGFARLARRPYAVEGTGHPPEAGMRLDCLDRVKLCPARRMEKDPSSRAAADRWIAEAMGLWPHGNDGCSVRAREAGGSEGKAGGSRDLADARLVNGVRAW
jgi:hypothetical protein